MNSDGDDWSQFRDRFAVELIGDDGILIDLASGSFFHLNPTASKACVALQQSTARAEAIARLAASMALAAEDAAAVIDDIQGQLTGQGVRTATAGPFRYRRHEEGYALEENGKPILTTDPAGEKLRLHARPDALKFRLVDYVRAMTPKLLYLRGIRVLHASACELREGVVAFSGRSGAGKTTTARAFQSAGGRLISEDLVVLAANPAATVIVDGEKRAHDWAAATADEFARDLEPALDCGALADVQRAGSLVPLTSIWFVDNSRRSGETFRQRALSVIDGVLALLANNFLGSDGAESWRRHIRETHAIAGQVALREFTMPEGVDRLAAAARAYATKTAS